MLKLCQLFQHRPIKLSNGIGSAGLNGAQAEGGIITLQIHADIIDLRYISGPVGFRKILPVSHLWICHQLLNLFFISLTKFCVLQTLGTGVLVGDL